MTRIARAIPPIRMSFCWSRHQTLVPMKKIVNDEILHKIIDASGLCTN